MSSDLKATLERLPPKIYVESVVSNETPASKTAIPTESSMNSEPSSLAADVPYFRVCHHALREPLLMVNHWGCEPLRKFALCEPRGDEHEWVSDILSPTHAPRSAAQSRGWEHSPFSTSNSPISWIPISDRESFCLADTPKENKNQLSTNFALNTTRMSSASNTLQLPHSPPCSSKPSVASQQRALLDAEKHEFLVFERRVLEETSVHGIVAGNARVDWEQLVARIGGETTAVKAVYHHVLEHTDMDDLKSLYHIFDRMGCYILAEQLMRRRRELCRSNSFELSETLSCLSSIGLSLQQQGKNSEAYEVYSELHEKQLAALGQDHPDTCRSAVCLGVCMRRQGMFAEAGKVLCEAHNRSMEILGGAHRVTLEALREYALFLLIRSRLPEVQTVTEDICERHTAALGASDPDTLDAISIYVWILQCCEDIEEATKRWYDALAVATHHFGVRHPKVLQYRRQLAMLLEETKAEEGCDIMKDLVSEWEALSGSSSPQHLRSAHDAGVYYARMRNFACAAEYFRIASNGFGKMCGKTHSFTILCQSKLARSLFYAQDYAQAATVMGKVHASVAIMFGDESEARYGALNNLAIAYCRNYQSSEALCMARDASTGWTSIAQDNPRKTVEALISVKNLGIILQEQGKLAEAERQFNRVYNGWRQALGEYHENTLLALHHIGHVLRDQRRMQEAEPVLQRVLKLRTEVLGMHDPDTLDSHHHIAVWNKIARNSEEALAQHEYVEKLRIEIVGENHTDTLMTRYHLGLLYSQMTYYDDAIDIMQECLRDAGNIVGWDHPLTLNVLNALANGYADIGDEDRADRYYRKALVGLEKTRGNAHPDTLCLVRNLATNYHYLKKYDVAEGYWRRAVDGMIQYEGPNHPETLWAAVQLALVLEIQFKDIEAEKYYQWVAQGHKKLAETDMSTLDPQSFTILHDIERLTRHRTLLDPLITNPTLLCVVKAVAENFAIHIIRAAEHIKKMWKQKRLFCPRRRPQDVEFDFCLRDEVDLLMESEKESDVEQC